MRSTMICCTLLHSFSSAVTETVQFKRYIVRCSLLCLTALTLLNTGCVASLYRGDAEVVPVSSSPKATISLYEQTDNGMVRLNDEYLELMVLLGEKTTPTSLLLQRNRHWLLKFSRDGYDSAEVWIRPRINGGALIIDILGVTGVTAYMWPLWWLWGPLWLIAGLAGTSDGLYDHTPETVQVILHKISAAPGEPEIIIAIEGGGQSDALNVITSDPEVTLEVIPVK